MKGAFKVKILTHAFAIFALVVSLFPQRSIAWPPTFGAEFTFTNTLILSKAENSIVNSAESVRHQILMRDLVAKKCATRGCRVEAVKNSYDVYSYRVTFENGWWFQISTDPAVVEIQTKPTTSEEFEANRDHIDEMVFKSAVEVGMKVHRTAGGGHIHIGLDSAIGEDAALFRNFLVDFVNHSEVAQIYGRELSNSPMISDLRKEEQEAFVQVIRDFDAGKYKDIRAFARALQRRVYHRTLRKDWDPPEKYQAFNVIRIENPEISTEERTLELRAHRAQKTVDEFLLQIQLYEARIKFLKDSGRLLRLHPLNSFPGFQGSIDRFHLYVTESGLDWEKFKPLLRSAEAGYRSKKPNKAASHEELFGSPQFMNDCNANFK